MKPILPRLPGDHPVGPRVAEKMVQCLAMDGNFGNPLRAPIATDGRRRRRWRMRGASWLTCSIATPGRSSGPRAPPSQITLP